MTVAPPVAAPAEVAVPANEFPNGLTSDEARRRFEKCGPNSMPDMAVNPLRRALTKFWSPFHGCSKRQLCWNWCSANMSKPG
jgi:H+-transporting ATPase